MDRAYFLIIYKLIKSIEVCQVVFSLKGYLCICVLGVQGVSEYLQAA